MKRKSIILVMIGFCLIFSLFGCETPEYTEEEKINRELEGITLTIDKIEDIYLEEIDTTYIQVHHLNTLLYSISYINEATSLEDQTYTVTFALVSLDQSITSNQKSIVFSGFKQKEKTIKEQLDEAIEQVKVTIESIEDKLLDSIEPTDLIVSFLDTSYEFHILSFQKEESTNTLTVVFDLQDVETNIASKERTIIFQDFLKPLPDPSIKLEEELLQITLSLPNLESYSLSDIEESMIVASPFDLAYTLSITMTKEEKTQSIDVTYSLYDPIHQLTSSQKTITFTGFLVPKKPVKEIVQMHYSSISIKETEDFILYFSLLEQKEEAITFSFEYPTTLLSTTKKDIVFNCGESEEQSITFSSLSFDSLEDQEAEISIYLNGDFYQKIILKIENIDQPTPVSILIDTSFCIENGTSKSLNIQYTGVLQESINIQLSCDSTYLSFDQTSIDLTKEKTEYSILVSSPLVEYLLESIKASILVLIDGYEDISIEVEIKKNAATKVIEIIPYLTGIVTDPDYYYTAYYDIEVFLEKAYVEFNEDNQWIEIKQIEDNSFTDCALMVYIPDKYHDKDITVRIKGLYQDGLAKIEGIPEVSLEGYQVKVTCNGVTEYFAPWATIPLALASNTVMQKQKSYLEFHRDNILGITEDFYVPLRPKGTSQFTINGLVPSNMDKVFVLSQDRTKHNYIRITNRYTRLNSMEHMTFYDTTDPTLVDYESWCQVKKDTIETFNTTFSCFGIPAHIEEVNEGESNNTIHYGLVPGGYAGLCEYSSASNTFHIYVGNNYYSYTLGGRKSTLLHEMGHLLGFNDSAYAIDDSIYSYARDHDKITYFQPNDYATMRAWMKYLG